MSDSVDEVVKHLEIVGVRLWRQTIERWSKEQRWHALVWCDAKQEGKADMVPAFFPMPISFESVRARYMSSPGVLFPLDMWGEKFDTEVVIQEASTEVDHIYPSRKLNLTLLTEDFSEIRARYVVHNEAVSPKLLLLEQRMSRRRHEYFRDIFGDRRSWSRNLFGSEDGEST